MKTFPPVKTPAEIAAIFGCSVERARLQLTRNLDGLRSMQARAIRTGRLVNNYTADELAVHVARFEKALAA